MNVPLLVSRNEVRYLPERGQMVVLESRLPDGWRCGVVANCRRPEPEGHVDVTDAELGSALALADVTIDASDLDGLAMLWLGQVWSQSPGSQLYQLARVLAQRIRQPGGLTVDWTPEVLNRLSQSTHQSPQLVLRRLARLADNGFLSRGVRDEDVDAGDGNWLDCPVNAMVESGLNNRVLALTFPPRAQSLPNVLGRYPLPEAAP